MARDPFAPVTQSSVPSWIWVVAGTFLVLLIGFSTTVFLVISRRPAQQATVTKGTDVPQKPSTAGPATASVGSTAPDKAPDTPAPATSPAAAKDDGAEGKHHSGHHRHSGKGAVVKEGATASAPAAPGIKPPKKKVDMSQKEIDTLLGL